MNLIALALALASLSSLAIDSAAAQVSTDAAAFPNRSIKIVVPFPAGGPSDVLARMIGQKMSEDWGQPVVIENRVGANTVLGAQQVAKAAPDGYTLLMAIDSTLTMNQYLYRNPPYDPFTDFVPITLTAQKHGVHVRPCLERLQNREGCDRQRKGAAGQAELRRRYHHQSIDGALARQGGRDQDRPAQIQWQRPGGAGPPDQERGFHPGRNIGLDAAGAGRANSAPWRSSTAVHFPLCRTSRTSLPSCPITRRSRCGSGWLRPRGRRRPSWTSFTPRWRRSSLILPSRPRRMPRGCSRPPARRRNLPHSSERNRNDGPAS